LWYLLSLHISLVQPTPLVIVIVIIMSAITVPPAVWRAITKLATEHIPQTITDLHQELQRSDITHVAAASHVPEQLHAIMTQLESLSTMTNDAKAAALIDLAQVSERVVDACSLQQRSESGWKHVGWRESMVVALMVAGACLASSCPERALAHVDLALVLDNHNAAILLALVQLIDPLLASRNRVPQSIGLSLLLVYLHVTHTRHMGCLQGYTITEHTIDVHTRGICINHCRFPTNLQIHTQSQRSDIRSNVQSDPSLRISDPSTTKLPRHWSSLVRRLSGKRLASGVTCASSCCNTLIAQFQSSWGRIKMAIGVRTSALLVSSLLGILCRASRHHNHSHRQQQLSNRLHQMIAAMSTTTTTT
jgi:hypothetical protein